MRRSVPRAPILFALLAVAACSRGDRSSPPPPQTSTIHPASPPPRANVEDLRARGRPRPGDASLAFQAKGAALAATNKTLGASVSAEDGAIALAFRGGTRDASLRLLRVGRPGAMEEISGGFKVGCAATPGASCVERTSTEGTLVEWWDNRPDGMEHAFRLDEAPAGEGDTVAVELHVGFAEVSVVDGGARVEIVPLHGPALSYGKLSVKDARGRALEARFEAVEDGVAITFSDRDAEYPVVVDPELSQSGVTRTWEASTVGGFGELGWSVTAAGDVNGDGYDDVLVGTSIPRTDRPSTSYVSGRVFLFLGGPHGPTITSWTAGWTATKSQPMTAIGIGDVNGDGYADVSVFGHLGELGDEANSSRVYLGSPAGLSRRPALELSRKIAWPIGDVDGDGYADVAAAWIDQDVVELLPGSAAGLASSGLLLDVPGRAMEITHGDFDGDRREDFVVGAPYAGAHQEGAVYFFAGKDAWSATPTATWVGSAVNQHLGTSVQTARDVDGDGYDDLLVARSNAPWYGTHTSGVVELHRGGAAGPSSAVAWSIDSLRGLGFHGPLEGWGIQAYVSVMSGVGDLDGDGYADVIVGAPEQPNVAGGTGQARVYLGSASGLATEPALTYALPDVAGAEGVGRSGRIFLGHAVAGVGDVNGDGHPDVLVAADSYSGSATSNAPAVMAWGTPTYAGGLVCLNDCAGPRQAAASIPSVGANGCVSATAPAREVGASIDVACGRCTASQTSLCTGKKNACDDEVGGCSRCDANLGQAGRAPCRDAAKPVCTRTGPHAGICEAGCVVDYKGGAGACRWATPLCQRDGASAGHCFACDGDYGSSSAHPCHETLTKCVTSGPSAGTCTKPPSEVS